MSAETKDAIERAIQAHIDAEALISSDSNTVVGWILMAAYTNLADFGNDRGHSYFPITPDQQPFHHTLGLAGILDQSVADMWASDDSE